MPGFNVRRAGERDLDVLVFHRRRMWQDLGETDVPTLDASDAVYRRWARRKLRSGTLVGFVAEDARGRAVASGCVWLRPVQPFPGRKLAPVPYLLSMFTEPAVRGRGLATRIVNEAVRWCRREGYTRLLLHASPQGRSVYRRLGFTRTWEMRLRLPPKAGTRRGTAKSTSRTRSPARRGAEAAG